MDLARYNAGMEIEPSLQQMMARLLAEMQASRAELKASQEEIKVGQVEMKANTNAQAAVRPYGKGTITCQIPSVMCRVI
jgi:uncharacterized protein with PIN domain